MWRPAKREALAWKDQSRTKPAASCHLGTDLARVGVGESISKCKPLLGIPILASIYVFIYIFIRFIYIFFIYARTL